MESEDEVASQSILFSLSFSLSPFSLVPFPQENLSCPRNHFSLTTRSKANKRKQISSTVEIDFCLVLFHN